MRMLNILAALIAVTLAADAAPDLTGTWNMGLQGGHVVPVALVLKQDGTVVTGTVAMPTQHVGERKEIELKGAFEAGVLKISGAVDGAAEPTTIEVEGTLQEDGSMEGTLSMIAKETRRVPWTAERLKERRQ
jgi:hypothetical protein